MGDCYIGVNSNRTPDLMYPVVGFRAFSTNEGKLISPFKRQIVWSADEMVAECLPLTRGMWGPVLIEREPSKLHAAPDDSCQCGLYMYYRLADVRKKHPKDIVGIVSAYGQMCVHQDGVRAERMILHVLGIPAFLPEDSKATLKETQKQITKLAKRVGVPIAPNKSLSRMADEYGQPIPPSLLPDHE